MDKNIFFNLFAAFDRNVPADQYAALRQSARAKFQAIVLPTQRNEDWRFTNIAPLLETAWVHLHVRVLRRARDGNG